MATATDWAVETVLASKATRYNGTLTLVHRAPGVILAGSGTTKVGEAWGAIYRKDAATASGQWFKTKAEAQARFDEIQGESVCDEVCGRMRCEVSRWDRPHTDSETCAGCGAKLEARRAG